MSLGKRAIRAPRGSAGVVTMACMQEEDWCNTGQVAEVVGGPTNRTPARDRPGRGTCGEASSTYEVG